MQNKTIITFLLTIMMSCLVTSFGNSQSKKSNPLLHVKPAKEIFIESDKIWLSDLFYSDREFNDKIVRGAPELGKKLKLYDKPDRRKIHLKPIVFTGGLSIFLSSLLIIIINIFPFKNLNIFSDTQVLIIFLSSN